MAVALNYLRDRQKPLSKLALLLGLNRRMARQEVVVIVAVVQRRLVVPPPGHRLSRAVGAPRMPGVDPARRLVELPWWSLAVPRHPVVVRVRRPAGRHLRAPRPVQVVEQCSLRLGDGSHHHPVVRLRF